ncbi:galactonate dehydratase [Nonomuraea endophytica]|uniref:Galactonate dehydratase n=1 Tax=Nonomuraea endophytica TaxID=714136 RepID=A0A7W8A1S5_9ACTN|nr:galactonate dehydratase [Nonomuraea endophytica]MBB5077992.1 galactonate dehydratase [Nonomuraea endophytica]
MKISGFELFFVEPRWLFLRVDTDEGVSGWGEPIVEGRAETVAACVRTLMDVLSGADPRRVEDHWQVMTKGGFYRGGPVLSSAVSGIDQALWDIKGKALGVPVYELLGGPVRDRVRVYTWTHGDTPEALAEDARAKAAAGFTAVKFAAWNGPLPAVPSAAQVRAVVARLAAVREAVGDGVDVGVDLHGRFSAAAARRVLPLLEEYLPMFAEEPVLPEFSRDLRRVVESTSVPIATGERLYSRWDFRDVLTTGIAVAQPDLSHAGGISEVRRIAAMAETHDVTLAPHCPLGPIALAACLQVDFATPNFLIQEQSLGVGYNTGADLLDYLADPSVFAFSAGHVGLPSAPGLGVEVDERAVRQAAERGHTWRNPVFRHEDGSFAEW